MTIAPYLPQYDLPDRTSLLEHYAAGFPPILGRDPRVLILGTLPGAESLKQQQYYAHPQNAFWKMLEALFNIPAKASYAERCEGVKAAQLAIWDVCHSACRPGSLDSAISAETVVANDITGLLAEHPTIKLITFNGNTAAALFKKHFKPLPMIDIITLPSTSPTHASLRFAEKLERWQVLKTR